MKLNKFIFGATALALCSGAFAQTVTFHSGIDYTIWGYLRLDMTTTALRRKLMLLQAMILTEK